MTLEQIVAMLLPVVRDVIAGALTMSDSGTFGGAREANAITAYLRGAAANAEGNTIIQGIVAGMFEGGALQLPDLDALDVTNLFQSVGDAAALLNQIEGGVQVRQFIYGLAEHVAGAAGGGLFGGGQKINPGEQQYLAGLRAQLGL